MPAGRSPMGRQDSAGAARSCSTAGALGLGHAQGPSSQGVCWGFQGVFRAAVRRMNPYADMAYDGVVLNPLEVLFVKIKGFQLDSNWVSTRLATTYARWAQDQVEPPATLACAQPTHSPAGALACS